MDTIKLPQQTNHKHIPGNTLFLVATALLVLVYLTCQPEVTSIEQVQNIGNAYDLKTEIYFLSFLIMLLCALTPLPAELIALANTLMYSPAEAFFVTWVSAVISAQVGYEFGRLNNINPCRYQDSNKICQWLTNYGYKALAIMRLVPVVPFFALNICGGIFKLNRVKYMGITAVTIIPAVAILTFFPHLFIQ